MLACNDPHVGELAKAGVDPLVGVLFLKFVEFFGNKFYLSIFPILHSIASDQLALGSSYFFR